MESEVERSRTPQDRKSQQRRKGNTSFIVFGVLHLLCCGIPLLILSGVSLAFLVPSWPVAGAALALLGVVGFIWYLKRGCATCPRNEGRCVGGACEVDPAQKAAGLAGCGDGACCSSQLQLSCVQAGIEIGQPEGRTPYTEYAEQLYEKQREGRDALSASGFWVVVEGCQREWVCMTQCNMYIQIAEDPELKEAIEIYRHDVYEPNVEERRLSLP